MVNRQGLGHKIRVDSAGTGDWHLGRAPDRRALQHAAQRGYDMSDLRARLAIAEDFYQFDYILAMDRDNFNNLRAIQPQNTTCDLRLFLDFSHNPQFSDYREVPDPYYGGDSGFDLVLDLVEDASAGLLEHIKQNL
jgi:protein-tyrosine phosphatase